MKLFIAPGIVVLFLVAIAVLAFIGVSQQRTSIEELHSKRFTMFAISSDLVTELTRVNEGMLKVMTYSEVGYSEERINKVIEDATKRVESVKSKVAETLLLPYLLNEERAALEGLAKPLADYQMWSLRVMDMASGDIATAAVYLGTAEIKFKILRGVLESLEELEIRLSNNYYAESVAAYKRTLSVFFVGIVLALGLAIATTVLISRRISRPVREVVDELARITGGEWDLTRRLPVLSRDEISAVTLGLNTFIEKLQTLIQKIAGSTQLLGSSSRELSEISSSLSRNASETADTTSAVVDTTQNASQNVTNISEAAEAMSEGMSAVATSIDQMSSSLQEVVHHCQEETRMAATAKEEATGTRNLMSALSQSSKEIGKIVDLIKTIAAQTNLLALNANIEAASAGAAGKGFAVVAREVKELAQKTAKATDQISSQIEAIQQSASHAGSAMEKISTIISEINDISHTIVGSIEELSRTTSAIAESTSRSSEAAVRIAHNVAESARGLSQVTHDVKGVFQAATDTSGKISQLSTSAQGLTDLSSDLEHVVQQFKV